MNGNKALAKTGDGFSLIELMVIMGILAILAAATIPTFSAWLPNYRLRSAAQDLYSAFQLAKMQAVKNRADTDVNFDPSGSGSYTMPDGSTVVNLASYKSGVRLGRGNATRQEDNSTAFGSDFVITTPNANQIQFNSTGLGSNRGFIYIQNEKNTAYAIGSRASGVVILKQWDETDGQWE